MTFTQLLGIDQPCQKAFRKMKQLDLHMHQQHQTCLQ